MKTEHEEQRELVSWFRKEFRPVRIFAIPNGGLRNKSVAAKLKVEGVSAGVPDLYVPAWRLWIEMKREKGGRLSDNQKDWRDYLQSTGSYFILGEGCEKAKEKIIRFYEENAFKL